MRSLVPLVLALVAVAGPAMSTTDSFTEDFASLTCADLVNTTAVWDTAAGEVRLPPFHAARVRSLSAVGNPIDPAPLCPRPWRTGSSCGPVLHPSPGSCNSR